MIQVINKAIKVEGTLDEIDSNVITFIELFMNNKSISKFAFGKGYEEISNYFCLETLLVNIFTICSADEGEFNKLLDVVDNI